jgi:iron complex outermembrane receptor protein
MPNSITPAPAVTRNGMMSRSRKAWLLTGAAMICALPLRSFAQSAPATTPASPTVVAQADTSATTTATAAAADAPAAAPEEVIVTGTRQSGRTKQQSPAPIDFISAKDLQATGEQNVFDALNKVLPSLDLPPIGFDTAGLVRSARLRGLSPDDVLILIDGKRRHVSANINADIGPVGGSDPVDLDMIPISLIDHIEVLRDGAAAQYGSDAIAGVINIILKHADHGGSAYAQEGATYVQDGFTNNLGASAAVGLNGVGEGFFDFGADYRYHDHTNRDGTFPSEAVTGTQLATPFTVPNPKTISQIEGDPRYNLVNLGYNTGYTIGSTEVYSFGTYGYRHSEAFENYRDPNTSGTYTPTAITPATPFGNLTAFGFYPEGFEPLEASNEDDYAATVGVKGELFDGWNYDLSSTYGGDIVNISTIASINTDYLHAFGTSPTSFHAGEYNDTEWTNNLDINKPIDVPFFAKPLNIAFGAEFRRNTYQLEPGDGPSQYGGGSQAYPGFTNLDAGQYHRTNEAVYTDWATYPLENWQIDVAGRFEHYSDVKDTETGKVTSRYDIFPWLGIRGTISNGFRAPSLAQEGFEAVNVGPTTAGGQFPVNSAAARFLGSTPLKPERSQNYEAGIVAEPIHGMHVGLDVYQIDIRDQIVDSGLIGGANAFEAFALSGALPPTCTPTSGCNLYAQYYTNGVNTKTRGADLTVDYTTFLGDEGKIAWVGAVNANYVKLTRVEASAQFTPDVLSEITSDTPKSKIILQGTYSLDPWSLMLRVTRFGQSVEVLADGDTGGAPFTANRNRPAWIGDTEIGYKITPDIQLTLGANNFTDKYAAKSTLASRYHNAVEYIPSSPYGIDGGFYYGRVAFTFGAPPAPPPAPPEAVVPPPPVAAAPVRTYLVFFDWDRADLTDRAKQIVASAAQASTHVQTTRIEVDGYTDLSGTVPYNQRLSVRRAQTVQNELVRDGVPANEIAIHGYGESNPLVPTAPGVREPQNRRVEIILKS